jgi:CheY-like chemotaxis protein
VKVLQLQSGAFREYEGLNPHFRSGAPKLRYVLDTSLDNGLLGGVRALDLDVFLPFFHRLSAHACGCGRVREATEREFQYEPATSLVTLQHRIDIAHYLEHLVLDIQYDLGAAESISGVTLSLGAEATQFMTVVESEDIGLCVFAVNTAMAMMHQALYAGAIDPRYRGVLQLARWLRAERRSETDLHEVMQAMSADAATARYGLRALKVLEFPVAVRDHAPAPTNLGPVLVVDDNEAGRALMHESLTSLGYDVRCAHDGRTGLDILSRYDTSAVVLDVYLPDVDGVSIARWLLESQPATKLVLISGGIDMGDGGSLSNSDVHFLPKPFRISALHDALQTVGTC